VKRLIVLLIVLAGGLAAAAFAVPSNAATVNGVALSQNEVSSDLTAIAQSPDYQCFLNAEEAVGTGGQTGLPPIEGVGQPTGTAAHPTATASFASNYVDTLIGHQLVLELAAKEHLHSTSSDRSVAHAELLAQMTAILQDVEGSKYACTSGLTAAEVLATMPTSFVDRTLQFDAAVSVFEDHEAGFGSSTADLQNYFNAHTSRFDTACFTVAEYTSESLAEAAAAEVAGGTPFATVAAQATGGGPQSCQILYGIASSLPAGSNIGDLPLNTLSSPIAINSDYLLIEITKRTTTPFTKATSEVRAAVQNAGADKARTAIDAAEKTAVISVDQRYGQWEPAKSQVVPPLSPLPGDVRDAAVDSPGTGTGQTP
jgi:hypothetical protein